MKSPRVSQEPGVGGGIPEPLLSAEVRAKLNAPPGGGPAGPAGPAGPVGPTEGTSVVNANQTPSPFPTPQRTMPSAANPLIVSTSRAGHLHVTLTGALAQTCVGFGVERLEAWAILDGSPIESSLRIVPGAAVPAPPDPVSPDQVASVTVVGVSEQRVPAGDHTLQIGIACAAGDSLGDAIVYNRVQAAVIVLG